MTSPNIHSFNNIKTKDWEELFELSEPHLIFQRSISKLHLRVSVIKYLHLEFLGESHERQKTSFTVFKYMH